MYHRGFVSSYEAMYHVVPAESKYQKGDSIPPVMKASAISNGLRCRRDKKHDYKRCDWRRGWRWRAWSWVVDTVPDPTSHWNLKMTNDRQLSVQNSFRVRRTSHPADIVRPGQRLWLWPCGFPGRNRENVSCDQSRISTVQISAPILPIIRDSFKRAYIRQHEEWEGEGAPLLEPMHPSPLQQTCTFVKNGSCSGMPSTLATKTSSWVLTFFIFNFQHIWQYYEFSEQTALTSSTTLLAIFGSNLIDPQCRQMLAYDHIATHASMAAPPWMKELSNIRSECHSRLKLGLQTCMCRWLHMRCCYHRQISHHSRWCRFCMFQLSTCKHQSFESLQSTRFLQGKEDWLANTPVDF